MTLSDHNPGFKVTVYLQVEYLKNGATLLNSTTHNYRPPWAVPKTCKNWGSSLKIFVQEGRKFSCLRTVVATAKAGLAVAKLRIGSSEGTSEMLS